MLIEAGPRGVTALEALRKAGSLRLAARISDLRRAGVAIDSEMIAVDGKRVARYTLRQGGTR